MELCNIDVIKYVLGKNGFRFSKSMGQNFLVDPNVPESIAQEAGLGEGVGVLEVGPGIGCLTAELAQRAEKVVAVELDSDLKPVLAETLSDWDNIEIVFADILKTDLKALTAEKFAGLRTVFCANLPYNITSPVLTQILESECFEAVTVMVQKEVAKRICAGAGTADYGAFTVLVNWYAETEMLFDVSPDSFIPQPKVTSSVIRLTRRDERPAQVRDEKLFFKVVRAAFGQRRKTLVNAVSSALPEYSKQAIAEIIVSAGYDDRIRGEILDISGFAKIANGLYELGKNSGC